MIKTYVPYEPDQQLLQSYLGLAGATGKISCRDPLSLTRKHR